MEEIERRPGWLMEGDQGAWGWPSKIADWDQEFKFHFHCEGQCQ